MPDTKKISTSYLFINFIIFSFILILQGMMVVFVPHRRIAKLILTLTLLLLLLIFFILDVSVQSLGKLAKTKLRQEVVISGHVLMIVLSIYILYSDCKIVFETGPPSSMTESDVMFESSSTEPKDKKSGESLSVDETRSLPKFFDNEVNDHVQKKFEEYLKFLNQNYPGVSFNISAMQTIVRQDISMNCLDPIIRTHGKIDKQSSNWKDLKSCIDERFESYTKHNEPSNKVT